MKRLLSFSFFWFMISTVWAQSEPQILSSTNVIGKHLLTNKDVIAKEIVFPEDIYDTFIDTVNNYLTVKLRSKNKNGKSFKSKGDFILIDLYDKKIKWSKRINYQMGGIAQFASFLTQSIAGSSYSLNYATGEKQWEIRNAFYHIEPYQMIGLGYKLNSLNGSSDMLEGIDLTDGHRMWRREINREYSWNEAFHLNDSTLLVAAAGLHTLNLKNGSGWDYNTKTGAKDYTGTIAANAAGLALGALTGTFVISTGHNVVTDVASNIWVDSTGIYFASREKIARLDYDGQEIWSTPLQKDLASKSSIFTRDSILYMINKGYASMGYRQIDFGSAFIAAFNTKTGEQIFLNTLQSKDEQVIGFEQDKDTLTLVFNHKIAKYLMSNGSLLIEKYFKPETYGKLEYFIDNQVYICSDSTFISLPSLDATKKYLYTDIGKTLVLNSNLEVVDEIDTEKLYVCYLQEHDYKFIAKGRKTIVLDKKNKIVASLDISKSTKKVGSKLYSALDNSLYEIELEDILPNLRP